MTKFVILCPIERKTAEEVVNQLFGIFCILGAPHILTTERQWQGVQEC